MKETFESADLREALGYLKKGLPKVDWYLYEEDILEAGIKFGSKPTSIQGYTGAVCIDVRLYEGEFVATARCHNTHPFLVDEMTACCKSAWPKQAVVEAVTVMESMQLDVRDRMQQYAEHISDHFPTIH